MPFSHQVSGPSEGFLAYEWKPNGDTKLVSGKVDRALTDSILLPLIIFSLNRDTASQRTIGDEGFSMGGTHTAAAVNQLLSEGLCRLSALQIG